MDDDERGEETRHCSDGVLSNNTTALQPACVFNDIYVHINIGMCISVCLLSNNTTALHSACVF